MLSLTAFHTTYKIHFEVALIWSQRANTMNVSRKTASFFKIPCPWINCIVKFTIGLKDDRHYIELADRLIFMMFSNLSIYR